MHAADDSTVLTGLGQWLRHARIASGRSMASFAAAIGVGESTVRAMERGSPAVRVGTWVTAAIALAPAADVLESIDSSLAPISLSTPQLARKRAPSQRTRSQ